MMVIYSVSLRRVGILGRRHAGIFIQPTFPRQAPRSRKSYFDSAAKGTTFQPQPSDDPILVAMTKLAEKPISTPFDRHRPDSK
jgi:hypothetical protein